MSLGIAIIIGAIGGLTSGLLGVGGGLIFVPLLVILARQDMHIAVATSLAAIVPTTLVGLARHAIAGKVEWRTALFIAVFAIAGAWLGASLSLKMDTVILRKIFALLIVFVAVKMFFQN